MVLVEVSGSSKLPFTRRLTAGGGGGGGGSGRSSREAVRVVPEKTAVIVTGVMAATGFVATGKSVGMKLTWVAPSGTLTLDGTVTAGLVLVSVTTVPPAGAGSVRVTTPLIVSQPPMTEEGLTVTERMAGVGRGVLLIRI